MFRIPLSPSVLDIKSSRGAEVSYGTNAPLRGKFRETNQSVRRQLRRIDRHQMIFENQGHDQKRRGEKAAHRSPQPGPERQRDKDRQRVQLEPAADNGRCDKMTFNENDSDKSQRRDQAAADGREGDQ